MFSHIKLTTSSRIMRTFVIIALLAIVVISFLSWRQLAKAYSDYDMARSRASRFDHISLLLNACHQMGNERGFANELLYAPESERSKALRALRVGRLRTDNAIAALRNIPLSLAQMAQIKETLAQARQQIDRAAAIAPSPTATQAGVQAMLDATGRYHKMMMHIGTQYLNQDIAASGYLLNALTLGELRDTLGRLAAPALLALNAHQPMTRQEIIATQQHLERVRIAWWLLHSLMQNGTTSRDIVMELDQARRQYESQSEWLIRSVSTEDTSSSLRTLSAWQFSAHYRSGLQRFDKLSQRYLHQSEQQYRAQQHQALQHLIFILLSLLTLLGLISAMVLFIQQRVLKPLLKINSSVNALISYPSSIPADQHRKATEIQTLFSSVDMLGRQISIQEHQASQLRRLAEEDPLTGLSNRRAFNELATRMLDGATPDRQPFLVLVDLDHFKVINDAWGHPFGDRVLVAVSKALQHCCRPGDIVARLGGEEFAILFPAPSPDSAQTLIQRLQEAIRHLRLAPPQSEAILITASLGVAAGLNVSLEHLIAGADRALYQAKATGRDRICWSTT